MRLKARTTSQPKKVLETVAPYRRPDALLLIAVAVLALVLTLLATLFCASLYRRAVADNRDRLIGLSNVLADQADRAFQSIELVQQGVLDEIHADGVTTSGALHEHMATATVHATLKARIAALPQVNAITVLDAAGRLVTFSRYWPIPVVDLSDRKYFQTLRDHPELQRVVSEPVHNRGDGTWTIYIARKISALDGAFLGMVLGAVELDYFERLYAQSTQGQDFTLSMFSSDGTLLARHPRQNDKVGRRFSSDWLSRDVQEDLAGRFLRVVSPVDGKTRFLATRTLAHYPVILNVSRTVWASLAPWRQQVTVIGLAVTLLNLGLLGLAVLGLRLWRGQSRLARAEAARSTAEEKARGEQVLRRQYTRFGVAMDGMSQGLCMFDGRSHLVLANLRLARIFGLTGVPAPGTPLHALLHEICASQALMPHVARWASGRVLTLMAARLPDQRRWKLPNGRTLSVNLEPMAEGGWVLTCEDVTQQLQVDARINFLAHHDPLTQLPNRTLFHERLDEMMRRTARGSRCAVLCLDLDGFKEVNDAYGHAVGDVLLKVVSSRLRECAGRGDTVARLGGDEFAVICPGTSEAAMVLATRMLGELSRSFDLGDHQVTVGASIGLAVAAAGCLKGDELLRHADTALYVAKSEGRNQMRLFEPTMDHRLQERRLLRVELCRALEREEFELFFQPLLRAATRGVVGFEALLRWRHPERGVVGPDSFIGMAEELGLIVPMGEWVLLAACSEAASWPLPLGVAVNLSAVQIREPGLVATVAGALTRSGLAPHRLELEITETVLLQETADTLEVLARLHALGVSIVMDDFGTGHSSLNYLRAFPFDKVKIDRSFMRNLERSREARAIVRAVVGLCTELGMATLAEGVETEEQLDILRGEGCLDVQGFLFSRPQPASVVPALLARFGEMEIGSVTERARVEAEQMTS